MIKVKVTLTGNEGHKNELVIISRKLLHSQTLYLAPRFNALTSNDIKFLDFDVRARSHVKVKDHRRGDICVLQMLLFLHLYEVVDGL